MTEPQGVDVLSEIQAEIDAIERARAEENAAVDRERQLRLALNTVSQAAESEKRLTMKVAALDSALALMTKIDKLVDQMPEEVPGSRSTLDDGFGARQHGIDDIAAFLEDTVVNSITIIRKRRDEAAAQLRRAEEKLSLARAAAGRLAK